MHVFYNFRLIPFYHSPTTKGHDSLEQKIFEEILKFAKEYHSFLFLQVATTDAIKSMHGSHPCLNRPWYNILIFRKSSPTCILRHVTDCSGFWTVVRKKGRLLHYSPLPITTGTKHRAEAALVLLGFFSSILYASHRKSPLKEEDYLHTAEPKKSKSKHEEGCTVRCDAAFLRNIIILLHSSSRN